MNEWGPHTPSIVVMVSLDLLTPISVSVFLTYFDTLVFHCNLMAMIHYIQ